MVGLRVCARSKLLMTEIPVELEEEMQASVMVEAFVTQLQVRNDTTTRTRTPESLSEHTR
jgi:hypothetical protein